MWYRRTLPGLLCPNACPVYEAEAFVKDGSPLAVQTIECATDSDATALAEEWGRKWQSPVKLYKVPAVNLTNCSSFDFWPDIKPIAEISAPPERQPPRSYAAGRPER